MKILLKESTKDILEIRHFEPFIFLPFGLVQEKLFFISPNMRGENNWLKERIFLYIENTVIRGNIIKIFQCRKSVIIVHIYPLQYLEKISGRKGQIMIIGYIISKELIKKYYEGVIFRVSNFFKLIEQVVKIYYAENSGDIVSDFVKMVNQKSEFRERAIDMITDWTIRCNSNWNEYIWDRKQWKFKILCKKRDLIMNRGAVPLFEIYKYLQKNGFESGIMVFDYEDYKLLEKRNIKMLIFVKMVMGLDA